MKLKKNKITKEELSRIVAEETQKLRAEQSRLDENALIDLAVLRAAWKELRVPGVIDDFLGGQGINDKIDDWFKNNMSNPLVRLLYKSLMLMGPNYGDRYDKKWEQGELEENV